MHRTIILALMLLAAWGSACQSGSEINGGGSPRLGGNAPAVPGPTVPAPGVTPGGIGSGTGGGEGGEAGEDDGGNDANRTDGDGEGDGATGPIEYPTLGLKGDGRTNCAESLATKTVIETKVSDTEMSINRQDVWVECYKKSGLFGIGACDQEKFLAEIRSKSLGVTKFKRYSKADLEKAAEGGAKVPAFAIYARSVTTHTGESYTFDKPLPVFPWPAPKARYAELASGAMKFTAAVTGTRNVTVEVEIKKVDEAGDNVKLQFRTTINGNESDRRLYDKFPLPKQATYTVDTKNRDVRRLDSMDWFDDEECEGSGQVDMSYQLCTKTKGGKTENLGCP